MIYSESTVLKCCSFDLFLCYRGDQTCPVWCDGSIENRPSRHYDLRVRETEAERKIAEKRTEDARSLWIEKKAALKEKMKKLGAVERIVSDRTELMNKLTKDLEDIDKQNAQMEDADSIDCECGDSQCRQRWLAKVSRSTTSIQSSDLEYLERLQELAASEISMKKDIADLERREKAHMRILQQADQFWASTENTGDTPVFVFQRNPVYFYQLIHLRMYFFSREPRRTTCKLN